MNTKAIYTVHENGKEHYFFSEHAGGFSYPFAVADFLHSLKGVLNDPMSPQKGLCAAPMLKQMKGNYLFPEEIEGEELFTAVKKEQMFQLAVKEQASFGIKINMEQDKVSFHFREGEEELQEFCDIGFPRHGERGEYSGETFYYAADNLRVKNMMDGIEMSISAENEEAYRSMILKAEQKQTEE